MSAHQLDQQAEFQNMRLVGHSDLHGAGDGMHINLRDGFAYVGHMGESRVGTSVVDVTDPSDPTVVHQIETPEGTHSHKVQIVGDTLVVNYERNYREPEASTWQGGIKAFDIKDPSQPREIGFYHTPGKGVHRMTYWEEPYLIMSGSDEGYSDQFLIVLDMSNRSAPVEAGRWWFPGMHEAGGEEPTWGEGKDRVAFHHAIVRDNRAYCGWWDAGMVILDISDIGQPELISHLDFGSEVSRCTHSVVPVPETDLVVVVDEETVDDCKDIPKQVRLVDISDETEPSVLSQLPVPDGDFCDRGGRFGPHNLHEMRPGTLQSSDTIYLTYFTAGLRVFDIGDPSDPQEIAYYVPPAPAGRPAIQLNDVIVASDGLIYTTDRYTGGLYILELTN